MSWKDLFLSANGRVGQSAFWIGFLILFVAGFVVQIIPILGQILAIAMIYPWICLFSKRLHDFGKSGWLVLLPFAVWIGALCVGFFLGGAGMIAGAMSGYNDVAAATAFGGAGLILGLMGLAGLVNLVFLLWVGLSKGDEGDNAYGPPAGPLGNAPPAAPAA